MLLYLCLPFWLVLHFLFSFRSLIYTPISLFFTMNYLATNFPMWYCMNIARLGGALGVGWVHMGDVEAFLDSYANLSLHTIWFSDPISDSGSHSGSLSRKGLGSRAPWIICDYDLATVISIWPFIQPRTCKMGSSNFAAMVWLNCASTTRSSLPSIPPT